MPGPQQPTPPPLIESDQRFQGVYAKLSPELLPTGYVSYAVNKRFNTARADTREGTVTPVSHQVGPLAPAGSPVGAVTRIVGSGVFSDPNGREWLLLATDAGVAQLRDGCTPRLIPLPSPPPASRADGSPVRWRFTQAFNVVMLWRGEPSSATEDCTPWTWSGVRGESFVPIDENVWSDTTSPVPDADRAELLPNRLYVPFSRNVSPTPGGQASFVDQVAVSDIVDYTRYQATLDQFSVNAGNESQLVRLFPWGEGSMLVFGSKTIQQFTGLTGDLSAAALQPVNQNLGCAAADSVRACGNDVFFLSQGGGSESSPGGVYRVMSIIQSQIQTGPIPVSEQIEPIIARINWTAAAGRYGAESAFHGKYYYLAVPLDNSPRNNAILVCDTAKVALGIMQVMPWIGMTYGEWEGIHQWPEGVCFDALHVTDWNGAKRVFAIDYQSLKTYLLYEGLTDIMTPGGAGESPITDNVVTRGMKLGDEGWKRFDLAQFSWTGWSPSLTVQLLTEDPLYRETLPPSPIVPDPTACKLFGPAPYILGNLNGDHETPDRQDYAVPLPFYCGGNAGQSAGITLETVAPHLQKFRTRKRAYAARLSITNTQGAVSIGPATLRGQLAAMNAVSY